MSSGVVALEKLRLTISMSGSLRNALNSVIVLPEPGGPQSIKDLCSDSYEYNTSSWRAVSTVGTTTSEAVTAHASISMMASREDQAVHSPVATWTL